MTRPPAARSCEGKRRYAKNKAEHVGETRVNETKPCVRCHGTGIEPDGIFREGRYWAIHPTKVCPVCGAPLMLGNPARNEWHCADLEEAAKGTFTSHYEGSRLIEARAIKAWCR